MTEPVRPLEALIAEKIAEWRACPRGSDLYPMDKQICADELAALLQAAAPPAPTADKGECTEWGCSLRFTETGHQPWCLERQAELKRKLSAAPPKRVSEGQLWEAFEAGHHAWPTPDEPNRRALFQGWLARQFDAAKANVAELPSWLQPERVSEGKEP